VTCGRKLLKALHEIGAIGAMGSFAACIVLLATAPVHSAVDLAAASRGIANIMHWLLMPSLALVLLSGLLAIALNKAFHDAGWAWLKALLGISLFEGTLLTVGASTRRAAELTSATLPDPVDPAELARLLHGEWGSLWLMITVSLANIVLAVWRPRFLRPSTAT
jgi:hypothetical protein